MNIWTKPLISLSEQTFLINGSKHNAYYKGDKLQSCFTQREILTGSDIKLFTIKLEVKSVYNILIQLIKFGPKLYLFNTLNENLWLVLSNGFSCSKEIKTHFYIIMFFSGSLHPSVI